MRRVIATTCCCRAPLRLLVLTPQFGLPCVSCCVAPPCTGLCLRVFCAVSLCSSSTYKCTITTPYAMGRRNNPLVYPCRVEGWLNVYGLCLFVYCLPSQCLYVCTVRSEQVPNLNLLFIYFGRKFTYNFNHCENIYRCHKVYIV